MTDPPAGGTPGTISLQWLRHDARKKVIAALGQRKGKKALVLDARSSALLNLVAEVALLREHGVEALHTIGQEQQAAPDLSLVYIIEPLVGHCASIATHIRAARNLVRPPDGLLASVFFLPRVMPACEQALEEAGIMGDISVHDLDVQAVPLEIDVVSLELARGPGAFLCGEDPFAVSAVARALLALQRTYGSTARALAVGKRAVAVCEALGHLWRALPQGEAHAAGAEGFTDVVVIDRAADLVTPLCTPMTYEGLMEEVLGLRNGVLELDVDGAGGAGQAGAAGGAGSAARGGRARLALNSNDGLFAQLRDLSFVAVGARLREVAGGLQQGYRDLAPESRSVSEMRDFVRRLGTLPDVTRHASISERLATAVRQQQFREFLRAEQSLLDGPGSDSVPATIEAMIEAGAPAPTALRLACLMSVAQGGVQRRTLEALFRAAAIWYGHARTALALARLRRAGLLRRHEGGSRRGVYGALKKPLQLLVDKLDERDPKDPAYAYAGYAPISVRIVQRFIAGTLPMELLASACGACVLYKQERDAADRLQLVPQGEDGGPETACSLSVMVTGIVGGKRLLEELVGP
ncbi:unnamed protein product [Pedinophyceae sp. YPF-701]|nr:unnamed protein product [Pedinophyceae sp. YPF-701]